MASLFSDLLTALGVRHTEGYSDDRFRRMPFQSLFGLTSLLKEYGVGSTGVTVDRSVRLQALREFVVPFLADTADGFVIVTSVAGDTVTYLSQHHQFTVGIDRLAAGWNGKALLVAADRESSEPDYALHRIDQIFAVVKRCGLWLLVAALIGVAMWWSGLYARWTPWAVLLLDCFGIWLSWMLVQKSLGVRSQAADAVCSVLQAGGCDEIARSDASSFMGIFKWSEVGLAYFSISLLAMLLFPGSLSALAAINILCLPYTVWSITYQKFVAKVWCTMCVGVQITLWLLAACYLAGGYDSRIFQGDFWWRFGVLAALYIVTLLFLNAVDEWILRTFKVNEDENS